MPMLMQIQIENSKWKCLYYIGYSSKFYWHGSRDHYNSKYRISLTCDTKIVIAQNPVAMY